MEWNRMGALAGAILLVTVSFACGEQFVNSRSAGINSGGSGVNTGNAAAGVSLTYETGIKTIVDKSCNGAGCHSAPGADGIPLDTYADLKKYYQVSIASIDGGSMPIPANKMTADEAKKLKDWGAAGMPEKASAAPSTDAAKPDDKKDDKPADTPAPPAKKTSFATNIAPMLQTSCLGAGCHTNTAPVLAQKAQVMAAIDQVVAAIEGNRMPLGNRTRPNAAMIQLLKDWKLEAFPD